MLIGISMDEIDLLIEYFNRSNITKQELAYQLYSRCKDLDPWLPIEDAPKDRRVLVYNVVTGPYVSRYIDGAWPFFGWIELSSGFIDGEVTTHYPAPTHYKELDNEE